MRSKIYQTKYTRFLNGTVMVIIVSLPRCTLLFVMDINVMMQENHLGVRNFVLFLCGAHPKWLLFLRVSSLLGEQAGRMCSEID